MPEWKPRKYKYTNTCFCGRVFRSKQARKIYCSDRCKAKYTDRKQKLKAAFNRRYLRIKRRIKRRIRVLEKEIERLRGWNNERSDPEWRRGWWKKI